MRIANKVWVVTGAGSGMGRELTEQLLAKGGRVAAVDRSDEGLARFAGRASISTHVVDITDKDAVNALPQAVLDAHGHVDGVINNAGIIQPFDNVIDLDDATVDRVLNVNLYGTLSMCRAFLPHLVARQEAHLVNVSSMGGFFPFPGQTIYGASKAAVRLLSEGLFTELVDTPVQVSVIFPGAVKTEITRNSGVEDPAAEAQVNVPMLSPAKAAAQMIAGIEKNKLHIYVGVDSKLMSLATKIAPRPAFLYVQKQMSKRLGQD